METGSVPVEEGSYRPPEPVSRRIAEVALWEEFIATRSPDARARLVESYMPLAHSLARRYRRAREPLEDLVQVASLGLVKAIDGFDPARGRPFTAYAVPTILGEIRRHFRDHVWTLRLPRSLQELTASVDSATEALAESLGRYPSVAELAERLGISEERVLEALEASQARMLDSLDKPVGDEESRGPMIDKVGGNDLDFDTVECQAAAEVVDLTERERLVLKLRFEDGMPQREIADIVGVSQMQISRISRAALWRVLCAVRGVTESELPAQPRRSDPDDVPVS